MTQSFDAQIDTFLREKPLVAQAITKLAAAQSQSIIAAVGSVTVWFGECFAIEFSLNGIDKYLTII